MATLQERHVEAAKTWFTEPQLSMSFDRNSWTMWIGLSEHGKKMNGEEFSYEYRFEIGYGDYPVHRATLYAWQHGEEREVVTREELEARVEEFWMHVPPEEDDGEDKFPYERFWWNAPFADEVRAICERKLIAIQEIVGLAVAAR